jgi:hypothetical protein
VALRSVGRALEEFAQRAEDILQTVVASAEMAEDGGFAQPDAESQLRELRAAMPRRPLLLDEGMRVAERQAGLLRWQLGRAASAALPTQAVTGLSFLTVTYRVGLAKSALVTKTARGWVLVLRAEEPGVRQRFSMAHELKHILDDPFNAQCPGGLYPAYVGVSADDLAERVCDRFAAALLMPKILVRRDWTNGIQNLIQLARRYNVSRAAMEVRLRQLGLLESVPRCGTALLPNRA